MPGCAYCARRPGRHPHPATAGTFRLDQAVASANGQQLKAAGAPAAAIQWLLDPDLERIAADHAWLDLPGHHLLGCDHEDFPHCCSVRRAAGALFIDGDPQWLWFAQIAIVGSHNPTDGGRANARDFAHPGALRAGGHQRAGRRHRCVHQAALDKAARPSPWSRPGRIWFTRPVTARWPMRSRPMAPLLPVPARHARAT